MEDPLLNDPLRTPFAAGGNAPRGRLGGRLITSILFLSLVACMVATGAFVPPEAVPGIAPSRDHARLAEPPIPFGEWALAWDSGTTPPAVQQEAQLRALRGAAAGVTALMALLAFGALITLRRQELRLRREESFVHWAVGARRAQLVARLLGAVWRPAALVASLGFSLTLLIPKAIVSTFPGDADVPLQVTAYLFTSLTLITLYLRWEFRSGTEAGERAARPREEGLARIGGSTAGPVTVAALGFAVLTGVGLLEAHTPRERSHGGSPLVTAGISLDARGLAAAGLSIEQWVGRLRSHHPASGPVGVASAGTVRGIGSETRIWVHCGRCSEGGFPMPVRPVRAKVFAVGQDTFPLLTLPLLDGRDFDDLLDADGPGVAIVSRALAHRHFEGGEAVGRELRIGRNEWLMVVGVVADRDDAADTGDYAVYLPVTQARPTELEVMAAVEASRLQALLAAASPGLTSSPPRTLHELFAVHDWFRRALLLLAGLAYVLVLLGVWLAASNQAQATRFELSLRRAMGATRRDLLGLFLGRSLLAMGAALAAGGWLALWVGMGLNRAYGGIPHLDPSVSWKAALPVTVALVAGLWPAHARSLADTPVAGMENAPGRQGSGG